MKHEITYLVVGEFCALFSARGFLLRFGVEDAAGFIDDFFAVEVF